MNPRTIDVIVKADLIIRRLLAVQKDEQVVIVCDPHSEMEMVYALAGIVESLGAEYTITMMPTRGKERANDLTHVIEKGLEAADCLIGITGASGAPTYSGAVKRLYDAKQLRTISMVMRSLDNFTLGGANADYDLLYDEGKKFAALWERARVGKISTLAGTDLSVAYAGERVVVECGFATEAGLEAAFSDGEVSQMPVEGSANGLIVVDGPIAHIGPPDTPIYLKVEAGKIIDVTGDCRQADELRQIIAGIGAADNIAEVGIGLNPVSRLNGDFEEEKKARGNVHIAIGDNVFYGGSVSCSIHIDMVIYRPTVTFDDQVVVRDGEIQVFQQVE